jgi:hypothetical protein
MLQRFFSVLLLVLSILASAWIYLNLSEPHINHIDPLSIVPQETDFVARLNTSDWTDFGQASQLLANMLPAGTETLQGIILSLDSARKSKDDLQGLLNESPLTLVIIQTSVAQAEWALYFQVNAEMHKKGSWGIALGLTNQMLSPTNGKIDKLEYYVFGNTVCLSSNSALFQPSYIGEKLKSDSLILSLASSWGSSPLNLVICPRNGTSSPQSYDLLFAHGVVKFVGYDHVLDATGTSTQVNKLQMVGLGMKLPDSAKNIAGWIGNGGSFANQKLADFKANGHLAEFNVSLAENEITCSCDVKDLLLDNMQSWAQYESHKHKGIVIGYSGLQDRFDDYHQLLGNDFSDYKGHPVFSLSNVSILEDFFETEENISHATVSGGYLILTSSLDDMQWYINEIVADRLYGYSPEATMWQDDFIPREGYFSFASNSTKLEFLPWEVLNKSAFTTEQSCNSSHARYKSIALHGNQQKSVSSTSGWRCTVNHTISGFPTLVRNHYTGSKEVFIQDDGMFIHLIDETGKELWKKEINSKILSEIQQVDLYKNGKLQLIFNTIDQIICLDRNGKDVPGFPIKLKSKATSPLAIFDYDNNRDYRLAIACANGEIYNYRYDGSSTKGWKYKNSGRPVTSMTHLKIKDKDYIFALEDHGNIHLLKRNGKSRYDSKAVAKHYSGNGYYFIKGNTIESTKLIYPDTLGNIVLSQFDKHDAEQSLTGFSAGSTIVVGDVNGDNKDDFVIVDERDLAVYDDEFKRIFQVHHEGDLIPEARIYRFSSVDRKLGVAIKGSDEILLYNSSGKLETGFPRKGNGLFTIGDLNGDGKLEAVVALTHGEIVSYPLN